MTGAQEDGKSRWLTGLTLAQTLGDEGRHGSRHALPVVGVAGISDEQGAEDDELVKQEPAFVGSHGRRREEQETMSGTESR